MCISLWMPKVRSCPSASWGHKTIRCDAKIEHVGEGR